MGVSGCLDYVKKLTKYLGYLAALLCIPLTFTVSYEVLMRSIFNKPTEWSYDISWILFAAMFLVGGAYTLQEERHVRVDILMRLFPKRMQYGLEVFFFLFMFLPMTGAMAWKGFDYARIAWNAKEMLSTTLFVFPAWAVKIYIGIGFLLLFLQGIVHLVENMAKFKEAK